MPLQVMDGIPIPTAFTLPGTLSDVLPKPQIDITRSPQKQDAWCYAACAEMVINHLTEEFTRQCEVVGFVKETTCCGVLPEKCIKKGCTEDQIGDIFTEFNVAFEGNDPMDPVETGPIDIESIRENITATPGRPIEVVVEWNTGVSAPSSSHALLIVGVNGNLVYVIDPLPGEGQMRTGWHSIESLQKAFGHGRWVRTWHGLRRQ